MQATHDVLIHSFNITKYDHLEFPGVVPRTFLGPLVLSATISPIFAIMEYLGVHKFWAQYLIRFAMAGFVAVSWHLFRKTIIEKLGLHVGAWFTVITITQFHFLFYMSRLLPNILALPLTLIGIRAWIQRDTKWFLGSAGAVIIIFRSELCILFGLFLLYDIYYKRITVIDLLKIGIPTGLGLILLTVMVDSYFWQRLLWPEAEVFWFNTFMNKSKDWGTSPFLWYFYSALPRALGSSLIFIPFGLFYEPRIRPLIIPAIFYILLYSFLPHKELRFIIYVFPLLNLSSACACSRFWENRQKSVFRSILAMIAAGHLLINCIVTMFLLLVSSTNYPGGIAMSRLHRIVPPEVNVTVHIGNLAAQTGVTRFTQVQDNWQYRKDEDLKPGDHEMHEFDYLLVEAKDKYSPEMRLLTQTHDILEFVECFSNIGLQYDSFLPIKIKTKPCIYIMERKGDARTVVDLAGDVIDDTSIEEFIETLSETLEIDEQLSREIDEEFKQISEIKAKEIESEEEIEDEQKKGDSGSDPDLITSKSQAKVRNRLAEIKKSRNRKEGSGLKENETESNSSVDMKTVRKSRARKVVLQTEEEKTSKQDDTSDQIKVPSPKKTRIREIFKDHFKRVNERATKALSENVPPEATQPIEQSPDALQDTPKSKLKKLIKAEQVKALIEDIQQLDVCDPDISPKDCLKSIIDEYIQE